MGLVIMLTLAVWVVSRVIGEMLPLWALTNRKGAE